MMSKLKKRNLTQLIAGVTILILTSGYAIDRMFNYLSLAEWVDHTRVVLMSLHEVQEDILNLETGQRGYLITGQEEYLSPYYEGRSHVASDLANLTKVTSDNPTQASRVKMLRALVDARIQTLNSNLELRRQGKVDAVRESVKEGHGREKMQQIRKMLSDMEGTEQDLLKDRLSEAHTGFKEAVAYVILSYLLSFVVIGTNVLVIVKAYRAKEASERKVVEQYRILNTFILNAPVAIAMFDADLNFLNVSKEWEKSFQINRNDVIGRNLYQVMPDMPDRWKQEQRQALTGLRGYYRDEILTIKGKREYVNRILVPWFENEQVGGIISYVEFITGEINTQNELRRIHEEISKLEEERKLLQAQVRAKLGS